MTWVAVAVGGAALLGGMMSSNAANNAAQAQTNAANQANATQWGMYNQTRRDQLPWMQRGNSAGNMLAYLMGLPGNYSYGSSPVSSGSEANTSGQSQQPQSFWDKLRGAINPTSPEQLASDQTINPNLGAFGSLSHKFGMSDFQADPGYAFRMAEGQKALERSAAAKGNLMSGGTLKALTDYGQNFASNEYGNAYNRYNNDQTNLYNRLAAIAGTGQQANQFTGQLGANTASQVANNYLGMGNAQAAAGIAGTNGIINGFNNGLNNWMQYQYLGNNGGNNSAYNWSNFGTGTSGGSGVAPTIWG